jgi:uncharacterized UBP type Zn finger protein
MSSVSCSHLDEVKIADVPARAEVPGCEECLKIGGRWLHLRVCRTCGKVGCCDSSPNRHARGHAAESGHPIVHSAEPGETWTYCFIDDVAFLTDGEPGA